MKRALHTLKYLAFPAVGIFLVWWSLHQIPDDKWNKFKAAFATANYWLIVPVFLILTLSHVLRAARWRMLMFPLGYKPTLTNTFFAVMVGYLANLAVPRLGEVLKCTILAKYEHVPAEKLVGTIVAERAFDVLCLGLMFLLSFALQFQVIGAYGINLLKKLFIGKGGGLDLSKFAIAFAVTIILVVGIRLFLKKFAHIKLISSIRNILTGIWQGLVSVKDMKHKWEFVFCSLGIWAMYLLGTWIGFNGTAGTAGLSIEVAVSALAFASIGMIITPGGIGAYAYFLAKILEQNGVAFEHGIANGTLQWFAQFLIIIFVGFISLGLLPWYNKKRKQHEKARKHSFENTTA